MSKPPTFQFGGVDDDDGYYYTGQTPFRKPNESKLRFHARRLISIQTLARLEYNAEVAETKFNRSLGPIELTLVGLGMELSFSFVVAFNSLTVVSSLWMFRQLKQRRWLDV